MPHALDWVFSPRYCICLLVHSCFARIQCLEIIVSLYLHLLIMVPTQLYTYSDFSFVYRGQIYAGIGERKIWNNLRTCKMSFLIQLLCESNSYFTAHTTVAFFPLSTRPQRTKTLNHQQMKPIDPVLGDVAKLNICQN